MMFSKAGNKRLSLVLVVVSLTASLGLEVLYWSEAAPPGFVALTFEATLLKLLYTAENVGSGQAFLFVVRDTLFILPGLLLVSQ